VKKHLLQNFAALRLLTKTLTRQQFERSFSERFLSYCRFKFSISDFGFKEKITVQIDFIRAC